MIEKLNIPNRPITLKQLRGFTKVVENGSIAAAARELHLTTAAVSMQLRDLERIAGIPLLEKKNRRLKATLAGETVLVLASRIDDALIEFGQSLDEITGTDHGQVSVGVVTTARYFVPPILAAFNALYPDITLKLVVGNRALIMEQLENMAIDFAITGYPPSHFKVTKSYIGKHPQVIIAHPSHRFANRSRIKLSALSDETLFLRELGSGTRTMTEKFFRQSKFTPKTTMEFGSSETIKQAVMAGMGIAVISAHTIAAEVEAGRLIVLPVNGLPIVRNWYVVSNQKKYLLPSAKLLWSYISKSGGDFLPNPAG